MTVEVAGTVRRNERTRRREVTWALLVNKARSATLTQQQDASLARALVEMTQLPVSTSDDAAILRHVASLCQMAFDFPVAASVTLGAPAGPDFVATGSRLAQRVDGAQVAAGEGPCQEAWESQLTVMTSDMRSDPRWPRLGRNVAELAVRSAVAVPVRAVDTVGCLNVYSEDPRLVEGSHVEAVELLSAAVTAVLHENDLKVELARLAEQFDTALSSRAVIDQAKGIIMGKQGCDPEQAWQLLVRISSTKNVKVRDVAARIVDEMSRG